MVFVGEGDGGEGVGGECALGGEGQKEGKGYIDKDMNARKKVGTRRSRRGHDREIDPPTFMTAHIFPENEAFISTSVVTSSAFPAPSLVVTGPVSVRENARGKNVVGWEDSSRGVNCQFDVALAQREVENLSLHQSVRTLSSPSRV